MLNQIIVVGRLVRDFEIEKLESGEYAKIVLAVPRSWKNADGEYFDGVIKHFSGSNFGYYDEIKSCS